MQGKAKNPDGTNTPNIWKQVKTAIIEDIQSIQDDRVEIVVIPFQHKALEEWREFATETGKDALIKKIKDYEIPLFQFNGIKTTRTCLYEPLQYVVDHVLSPDKMDILKLMTDGIPDEHQAEYEALIAKWCQIAKEKDAFGFYIMLTPQAVDGRIVLEQINPCRFGIVDVAELGGTNVSTLMLTPQPHIAFSVREDYGKSMTIKFNPIGNGALQKGYRVHVYSSENSYLSVDQIVEIQENYTVTVKVDCLISLEQMRSTLPVDENETMLIYAEPAEGMDQYPFGMTQINEDVPTTVEMINKPEKTVKFHVL